MYNQNNCQGIVVISGTIHVHCKISHNWRVHTKHYDESGNISISTNKSLHLGEEFELLPSQLSSLNGK